MNIKQKLVAIYFILLPFIDLITSLTTRLTNLPFTIGTIVKGLTLIFGIVYVVFISKDKNKKKVLIYYGLLVFFAILYFFTKPDILGVNNIILEITFNEAYDVEFNGFDNLNLSNKDLVAIKNTQYEIYIDTLDIDEEISIIMNGMIIYDYILENNILKIPSVDGRIIITKSKMQGTYYNITYENIINNNYPTRIREGNNLIIEFITDIPRNIYVINSNNYNYEYNILQINNITSDITIIALDDIDFPLIPDENSNTITIEAGGITQDNPVNVTDLLTMTFDGQNISNRIISQIDIILTYTSTTGSNQSIECVLTVDDKTYTQTISLLGKQNNATIKVSFTNLSISQYEKFYVDNNIDKITNGNIEISSNKITAYFSEN